MSELAGDTGGLGASSASTTVAAPPPAAGSTGTVTPQSTSSETAAVPKTLQDARRQREKGSNGSETANAGPLPFERHQAILKTARETAVAEARKQWETENEPIQWAKAFSPEQRQNFEAHFDEIDSNPVAAAQRILARANSKPEHAAAMRSWLASMLGHPNGSPNGQPTNTAQPNGAATSEPMPQPDLEYQGNKWYSAEQLAKRDAWLRREMKSEITKEFQPLLTEREQRLETEKVAAEKKAVNDFAEGTHTALSKLPHYDANRQDIAKVLVTMPARTQADIVRNAYTAYAQVVIPKLEGQAKQTAIADLDKKARAGTTVPGNGHAATPKQPERPKRMSDALRESFEARQRNSAAV